MPNSWHPSKMLPPIALLFSLLIQFGHGHRHSAWHSLYTGHGDIASLWPVDGNPSTLHDAVDGHLLMRNALRPDSKNRWTAYRDKRRQYVIPYSIVGNFSSEDKHRIAEAMAGVAKNSCVRFRRRRLEVDHLQIRNDPGQGCYSKTVGRLSGSLNVVNLETNESIQCASQLGLILHELLHVVGLWHEHQRWDRHKYIKIHRRSALPGTEVQLMKAPHDKVTRYGVPYDYLSVMHYPKDGFALFSGLIVLETRRPQFQDKIGHATNASPNDYLKVCAIYDCHRCMGRHFRRGRNTRARGRFSVQPVSERDVARQLRHHKKAGAGGGAPLEAGQNKMEQCRCQWQGCFCRMDDRWQWRPFGPPS